MALRTPSIQKELLPYDSCRQEVSQAGVFIIEHWQSNVADTGRRQEEVAVATRFHLPNSWKRLLYLSIFILVSSPGTAFLLRSDWRFRRRQTFTRDPSSMIQYTSDTPPPLVTPKRSLKSDLVFPSTDIPTDSSIDMEVEAEYNHYMSRINHRSSPLSGLSRFHLSMVPVLRQRFLTGQYPVIASFRENPTLRWLNRASAQVMINGTTIEKSIASFEGLQWLDEDESKDIYTVELLAELKAIQRPGYLRILPDRRLWITGFSVGSIAHVSTVDCTTGTTESVSHSRLKWPNELQALDEDTVLVSDGFLVPMKDRGGLYILHKGKTICITDPSDRWFYHRAVWIQHDTGETSILSARCRLTAAKESKGVSKTGQLVWLNAPKSFGKRQRLEHDAIWDLKVLAEGPDVMFAVADMDSTDDTIEVIASEFFAKQITLHSIRKDYENPSVVFRRVIDDTVGQAYGCILANLERTNQYGPTVIDSGSTVDHLKYGDTFSELLVTSHECDSPAVVAHGQDVQLSRDGGSLFSYKVPRDWKNGLWERSVVASGFKVNGKLSNMINPGAPGFVYTFKPHRDCDSCERPWIAVAGDCAESAYVFRPDQNRGYRLLLEVQCEATVGSIAIGYDDFGPISQESGYAKLYIPCYEQDKVLVLGLGGKTEEDDSGW